MDASSAASEIPDLLEFLRPSVRKYCGDAQLTQYGRDQYVVKTVRSGCHLSRSSTSMILQKTTHQVKEEYRISKGVTSGYHRTIENSTKKLIEVTVASEKQLGKSTRREKTQTKVINSAQDTCVHTNKLIVLIGNRKREKRRKLKKAESVSDVKHIKFAEYVDEDNLLHCQSIVSSLNMENKKRRKSQTHDKSPKRTFDYKETNRQQLHQSTNNVIANGSTRREDSQNRSINDEINKNNVKIVGKLGLTQDDKYVLRCAATINGVPIPTKCTAFPPGALYTSDGQRLKPLKADEWGDIPSYRKDQRHICIQTEIFMTKEDIRRNQIIEENLPSKKNADSLMKNLYTTEEGKSFDYSTLTSPLVVISVYPNKMQDGKNVIKVHKVQNSEQLQITSEKENRPQRSRSAKNEFNKEVRQRTNNIPKSDSKTKRKKASSPDRNKRDLSYNRKRDDENRSPVTRYNDYNRDTSPGRKRGGGPARVNSPSPNRKNIKCPERKPIENPRKTYEFSPERKNNNKGGNKTKRGNKKLVRTEIVNAHVNESSYKTDDKKRDGNTNRYSRKAKFNQNQAKRELVDTFTRQYSSLSDNSINLNNKNYSSVSVNIDGKEENYDLVFKQYGNTTDFKVRRTVKDNCTQINKFEMEKEQETQISKVDINTGKTYISDNSMEKKYPKYSRPRSVSRSFNEASTNVRDMNDRESRLQRNDVGNELSATDSLLLKVKDSIEVAHIHEHRDTLELRKSEERQEEEEEENTVPILHYRGDSCQFQDPIERETEIRRLLGVVKKRHNVSPTKSLVKQALDVYNSESRSPTNERQNIDDKIHEKTAESMEISNKSEISTQYDLNMLNTSVKSKENINIGIVYLKRKISFPEKLKNAVHDILSKKIIERSKSSTILTETISPIVKETSYSKVNSETASSGIVFTPQAVKSVPSIENIKYAQSQIRNDLLYLNEYVDNIEDEGFKYDEYISTIFSHIFKISDCQIPSAGDYDDIVKVNKIQSHSDASKIDNCIKIDNNNITLDGMNETVNMNVQIESKLVSSNNVSIQEEDGNIKTTDYIVESEESQLNNIVYDANIDDSEENNFELKEIVIEGERNIDKSEDPILNSSNIDHKENVTEQNNASYIQYGDYIIQFGGTSQLDREMILATDNIPYNEKPLHHTGDYVIRLDSDVIRAYQNETQVTELIKPNEYLIKYDENTDEHKVDLIQIGDDYIEVNDDATQTVSVENDVAPKKGFNIDIENEYIKYNYDYDKAMVLFEDAKSKRLKKTKATVILQRSESNPCMPTSSPQANYYKSLNIIHKNPIMTVKSEDNYNKSSRSRKFVPSVGEGDWFSKKKKISVTSNTDSDVSADIVRNKSKRNKQDNVHRYAIDLSLELRQQDSFIKKIKKCVIRKPSKKLSLTKAYRGKLSSSEDNPLNMYQIKTCLGAPHLAPCTVSSEGNSSSSSQFVSDEETILKKGFLNLVFRKLRHMLIPR